MESPPDHDDDAFHLFVAQCFNLDGRGVVRVLHRVVVDAGDLVPRLFELQAAAEDLHAHLNTAEVAFNTLGEKDLCPGAGMLEKINSGLR